MRNCEIPQIPPDIIPKNDSILFMGKVIPGLKQRYLFNEIGASINNFRSFKEICINNTFFSYKAQHKYTFQNRRTQKLTLEYVTKNKNIHSSQIIDAAIPNSANVEIYHNLLIN